MLLNNHRVWRRLVAWCLASTLALLPLSTRAEDSLKDVLKDVEKALEKPTPSPTPPLPQATQKPSAETPAVPRQAVEEKPRPTPKNVRGQAVAKQSGQRAARFTSKSKLVHARQLKALPANPVDTWLQGDFVAAETDGKILLVHPIWGGGFIRGYSTQVHVTFPSGVPSDIVRQLPQHPIDSTVLVSFPKNRPVYITRVGRGSNGDTVVTGVWY